MQKWSYVFNPIKYAQPQTLNPKPYNTNAPEQQTRTIPL